MIAWFIPLILNQVLSSSTLHRFHKLLAFVSAFVVLVVWTVVQKDRERRSSSGD